MNRGASFSNSPDDPNGPKWPRGLPRPVTHWDFTEGRLPE